MITATRLNRWGCSDPAIWLGHVSQFLAAANTRRLASQSETSRVFSQDPADRLSDTQQASVYITKGQPGVSGLCQRRLSC